MASALTRLIDPAHPSNRFVLAVTPLAGAIAGAVTLIAGEGVGAAARSGVSGGGVAFLAWAIGREIDHDRPLTACLAAVVAPWLLLLGRPDLLGSALLLLAVRLVAGTTGRRLIAIDAVALVAGAGLVATRPGGPAFAAAGVVALLLVTRYERSTRAITASAAVAMAAVAGSVAWWAGRGIRADAPTTPEWIVLAVAMVASLAAVASVEEVVTPADEPGAVVHRPRVRWARAVAGVAGLGAWIWIGGAGVAAAAASWTALGMAPLVAVVARIRR